MKNVYFKLMSCFIVILCICMPVLGAAKVMSKPSWAEYENATTIISEEIGTFSEIEAKEELTTMLKIRITPEDKILMMQTNKPITTSLAKEITEEPVIEEVTTKPQRTKEQTSLVTETTTTKKLVETTTEATTEEPTTEKPTEVATENSDYVHSDKYPTAAIIWNYLKDLGYNNAVCAGIMGNIMAEVGGQTLYIQPYLNDTGGEYYGICQWSTYYHPEVWDMDLYDQLDLLASTIRSEMNTFGYKYYSGFGYSAFLNVTDPGDAAYAFAACYERCATWTYSVRVSNAYTAYDYFT